MLLFTVEILLAQEKNKGDIIVTISAGPNLGNLLNSDAPHKINILGSDLNPVRLTTSSVTNSPGYLDYQTNLFKDIIPGIISGLQLEYFISHGLSLNTALNFESKGINMNYCDLKEGNVNFIFGHKRETDQIRINNKYLILPVLFRKYIRNQKRFFMEGGIYMGYLLSSQINYVDNKTITDNSGNVLYSYHENYSFNDKSKRYTNKIDYGFSVGGGFVKSLSARFNFKTEILLSFGMKKVDSKYNNEYSMTSVPSGSNFSQVNFRSTNYFGLNSNSGNISSALTIGIGYKIGKL